jgi:hypothetical protein
MDTRKLLKKRVYEALMIIIRSKNDRKYLIMIALIKPVKIAPSLKFKEESYGY